MIYGKIFRFLAIPALLASSMAFAQGPGGRGQGGPGGVERIANELGLAAGQKTQIQTILNGQRAAAQPLQSDMQTLQAGIQTAVKDNNKAQIETLSAQLGVLQGKMASARYASEAEIYALLTSDQKSKADTAFPNGLMGGGMGGQGGPGGMRRQQNN